MKGSGCGAPTVPRFPPHSLLALLNVMSAAVYLAFEIASQGPNRTFAATIEVVAGKAELETDLGLYMLFESGETPPHAKSTTLTRWHAVPDVLRRDQAQLPGRVGP
jgi:hypothetical protein